MSTSQIYFNSKATWRTHAVGFFLAVLLFVVSLDSGRGATYEDNFISGLGAWRAGPAWSIENATADGSSLTVDTHDDEFAWLTNLSLAGSWCIEIDLTFEELYSDNGTTGTAGIALGTDNYGLLYLVDNIYAQDGAIYIGMGYWTGEWVSTLSTANWYPGAQRRVQLRLERQTGSNRLHLTVTSPRPGGRRGDFKQEFDTTPVPFYILNQLTRVGLRGFWTKIAFHRITVETPLPLEVENASPADMQLSFYPGLTVTGTAGAEYQVQYSTSVEQDHWITLTNLTLKDPVVRWFDTTADGAKNRFYRAVQE